MNKDQLTINLTYGSISASQRVDADHDVALSGEWAGRYRNLAGRCPAPRRGRGPPGASRAAA